MADRNPTDRGSSGPPSIAPGEARAENTVFSLLLGEHPIRLTPQRAALHLAEIGVLEHDGLQPPPAWYGEVSPHAR